MATSIVIFVLLVVVFALLYKGTNVVLGTVIGKTVHRRHKYAEEIIDSGRLPSAWRRECKDLGEEEGRQQVRKRLKDLKEYFRHAPVFDSDETRRDLLDELDETQTLWDNLSWEQLLQESDHRAESEAQRDATDE